MAVACANEREKRMKDVIQLINRGRASIIWLRATVVLATALADLLFYRQPFGWPCGVFLLLVGLLLVARPLPASRMPVLPFGVLLAAAGAVVYRGGLLAPCLAVLAL